MYIGVPAPYEAQPVDSGFHIPLIHSPLDPMKNCRKGHSPREGRLAHGAGPEILPQEGLRLIAFQSHSDVQGLISDAEGDWRPLTKDWRGLNKASPERASCPE